MGEKAPKYSLRCSVRPRLRSGLAANEAEYCYYVGDIKIIIARLVY